MTEPQPPAPPPSEGDPPSTRPLPKPGRYSLGEQLGRRGDHPWRIFLAALGVISSVAIVLTGNTVSALVVLAIPVMIVIHELGHFVMAKSAGMKVTEFFFGFGPRLWSIRRGETEYGIKALPLGGYVRIIGMNNLEEVDEADESRTYRQKPYWRRMTVAVAGSFMHFVMAFLLLFTLYTAVGVPEPSTRVGQLAALPTGPSPAQIGGIELGDRIISVEGQPVAEWSEVPDRLRTRTGQATVFTVDRNGQRLDLTVTPIDRRLVEPNSAPTAEAIGFVGVGPAIESRKEPVLGALGQTTKQIGTASVEVVKSLGRVFSPSGLRAYTETVVGTSEATPEEQAETRFVSPAGLVRYADAAADAGLRQVLLLLFSINVFVGLFNLVPLMPFDGGHVAVATYERLRSIGGRRRYMVDFAKLLPVSYAVLLVLVLLGLSSFYLDIANPLPNPFE